MGELKQVPWVRGRKPSYACLIRGFCSLVRARKTNNTTLLLRKIIPFESWRMKTCCSIQGVSICHTSEEPSRNSLTCARCFSKVWLATKILHVVFLRSLQISSREVDPIDEMIWNRNLQLEGGLLIESRASGTPSKSLSLLIMHEILDIPIEVTFFRSFGRSITTAIQSLQRAMSNLYRRSVNGIVGQVSMRCFMTCFNEKQARCDNWLLISVRSVLIKLARKYKSRRLRSSLSISLVHCSSAYVSPRSNDTFVLFDV